MTDSVNALTVILERNIREDDVQHLVDAIRMLRDVASVTTNVSTWEQEMSEDRARRDIRKKIQDILWPPP